VGDRRSPYVLLSHAPLIASDLRSAAGWPHLALDQTGSTNSDATNYVVDGSVQRVWVTAREQISGRGRRGRAWNSPRGNLFASAAFSLKQRDNLLLTGLPLLSSLALRDAVGDVAPGLVHGLGLKWPNDLLLHGKKLAGILLEASTKPDRTLVLTVGMGVNCAWHPDEALYPTTSLFSEGAMVTADDLFAALALRFDSWLTLWDEGAGTCTVRDAWLEHAVGLGAPVVARFNDGEVHGIFESLDENGFLMLREENGVLRQISAADIFFGNLDKARA